MLQSQRDYATIAVRHSEPKPNPRPYSAWNEDALREAMMKDPAATGKKLPKDVQEITVYQNNCRADAQKAQAQILEVVKTLKGTFTRSDIADRLPDLPRHRIGAYLRLLKSRGKVTHPEGKAQVWVACDV